MNKKVLVSMALAIFTLATLAGVSALLRWESTSSQTVANSVVVAAKRGDAVKAPVVIGTVSRDTAAATPAKIAAPIVSNKPQVVTPIVSDKPKVVKKDTRKRKTPKPVVPANVKPIGSLKADKRPIFQPKPVAKPESKPKPVAKPEGNPKPVAKPENKPKPVAKPEGNPKPVAKPENKPVKPVHKPKPKPKPVVSHQPTVTVNYSSYNLRLVIKRPVVIVSRPGSNRVIKRASNRTEWAGTQNAYLIRGYKVYRGQRYWKVLLPMRSSNASYGWIKNSSKVQLQSQTTLLRVSKSRRQVDYIVNGRVKKSFKVVIGANSTPTPSGVFAVRDIFATNNARKFTGSHMIVTTAYSNVLESFDGGPPRVAFHGRGPASVRDAALGTAGSNGCLRLDNSAVKYLSERLKPGTPIIVS
jgi:lipoprotein-anchoring transpeptidase ErfK/SrfK